MTLVAALVLPACAPYPSSTATATATAEASATARPAARPEQSSTATDTPSATGAPTPTGSATQGPGSAAVSIITADVTEAGLEVSGIVIEQTDGSAVCTLTATSGSRTRTAEAAANPSGSNSYCPVLRIPRSDLAAGTWNLVLSYRSPGGVTGQSSSTAVEVP